MLNEYMEQEVMDFVSPYDVNPMPRPGVGSLRENPCDARTILADDLFALAKPSSGYDPLSRADVVFSKSNPNVVSKRTNSVFYEPSAKKVKLEMEEFGDLSYFSEMDAPPKSTTPVDELNTPVFEQSGFTYPQQDSYYPNWDNVKSPDTSLEFELCDPASILPCATTNYPNSSATNLLFEHTGEKNKIIIDNISTIQQTNVQTQPNNDMGEMCNYDNVIPVYVQTNDHDYDESPQQYIVEPQNNILSMPESSNNNSYSDATTLNACDDSNSSGLSDVSIKNKPSDLKLNVGIKFFPSDILSTPDVIDSVVSLEDDVILQILGLDTKINEIEDAAAVIKDEPPSYNIPSPSSSIISNTPSTLSHTSIDQMTKKKQMPSKRSSKRRACESDEEYFPPSKSSTNSRVSFDDSDDDDEDYCPAPKRRGRPPGRRTSVVSHASSSSFDNGHGGTYRELRDKNNEASRKSRMKRKQKEMELEKEAEELREKNIKLKAQVQEAERMVNTYRQTLMKVMSIK